MASNHPLVLYDPQETSEEVKAAAGFLAGFSGRTREAYTLDCASSSSGATSATSVCSA